MKRAGITLVELIIVISIVAFLAALFLPGARRAREQARATVCQSNIRQLLFSFQQYETDYFTLPYGFDRKLAKTEAKGGDSWDIRLDLPGWFWFDFLTATSNLDPEKKLIQCPSKHQQGDLMSRRLLYGNYAANRSLCPSPPDGDAKPYRDFFSGSPVSISTIRNAGSTLLLVDSGYALICWWQARDDPLMPFNGPFIQDTSYIPGLSINANRALLPQQIDDAIGGRHPNKTVNVGFADWHVARKKADELLVEKVEEEQYRRRVPLWEPE